MRFKPPVVTADGCPTGGAADKFVANTLKTLIIIKNNKFPGNGILKIH
jgi:hypothetical protein